MQLDRITISALGAAAVALIVCLWILSSLPRDAFWIADNGNKALVAERLVASGFRDFDFSHPAERFDEGGLGFPIDPPFRIERHGRASSVWLPVYPALAAPFFAWFGTPGFSLPAALGVATSAGLLVRWAAPFIGQSLALVASLLLALGTPLLFYGVTIWEHSLTVALTLCAWVALSRQDRVATAIAGAAIALGCFLRSEMALVGAATALALPLVGRKGDLPALVLGAAPIGASLLALHLVLYGDPLGPHITHTWIPDASAPGASWIRSAAGLAAAFGTGTAEAMAFAVCVVGVAALVVASIRAPSGRGNWFVAASALVAVLVCGGGRKSAFRCR